MWSIWNNSFFLLNVMDLTCSEHWAPITESVFLKHSLEPPRYCNSRNFDFYFSKTCHSKNTLGTRVFSRVQREFSVLAEGRSHARVTIKTWQKPETIPEKSLAPRVEQERRHEVTLIYVHVRIYTVFLYAKSTSVEPVKAILSTSMCSAIAIPAVGP